MKKWYASAALGLCLLVPAVSPAATGEADIRWELAELKKQIKAQQEHIDALEAKLGENLAKTVQAEVEKAGGGRSKVTLGNKLIDNLTLKGDLRVRYERREADRSGSAADAHRDRLRTRFRAGGVWKNETEKWEVGAGLATGGVDATSTNDTWSDNSFFETGDIRLDYAYGKHTLNDNVTVTLGQQKNPFETSWLLWDGDIRPVGLTGQVEYNGLFATVGSYEVFQNGNDISFMFSGQAGYEGKLEPAGYKLAVGYNDFDSKLFGGPPSFARPNPGYDYGIGDLYGELSMPVGPVKCTLYGQVWRNFGAVGAAGQGLLGGTLDPEEEDTGWVLGLEGNYQVLKLAYAYAQVGADSVNPLLKDADFGTGLGNGVDIKGHKLEAYYNFTKNFSGGGSAQLYEPMTRSEAVAGVEDVALYMVDFVYKF